MNTYTPVATACLACAVLGLAGAAQAQMPVASEPAQDTEAAEATVLAPVTVTAKGYEAQAAETPAALTVLTAEELARQQVHNLGEALRGQAGLAVSGDSAQGLNPVIRGLKKDSVVLLVDGMRLNSAQPAGAVASFMSLGLAEQVEVLKGPASVLYGTGALGGAINVRLPQARFAEPGQPALSGRARLGLDSASRGTEAMALLNASGGDHALMLGAALLHRGDYRSPDGKQPRTGYDSRAFIGQYRWRIDGRQQLRLSLQQHRDDDVWYRGSTRPHPAPPVASITIHSPRQQRRLYELGYSRTRSADAPLGLDLRLYRQEMQRTIYAFGNRLGRDVVTNDVNFATDGLDAKAEWLAHPQHLLSLGLNAWRMGASPERYQAAPPAFTRFARNVPFEDGRLQALGLYVQDDMQLGAWRVLAGLRHDRVRGRAASMANGARTQGLSRSDGASSASLGVMYELTPLLRPYANVARAFRAGDLRERFESGLRGDGSFYAGSPQIRPEKATQFEIGLKGSDARLDYALSFYRNRISDYITGVPLTGAQALAACGQPYAAICKRNANLGSVVIQGMEANLRWQPVRGHWLWAAYSRVRGDNRDLDEPLYQMPADSLSLGWEGELAAGWRLDAQARIVARQDRVATRFSRGTEDPTPGHSVLDLGATWRYRPDHSLRLAVKNLTDRRYHTHLTEGLPGTELPAPGRSLALSWNARF
ncbi:hemin receptor [Vandammella animalimorsus]|uniref:Hemin receptor n=1 Tax=Vandammella animalimorsus TaxID=2029117 RepID=A0A2A2T730_9BURK|nr:TonB-dependent receptor [Vandammella animalimorsus]PAT30726.1 hemin receptor [Vandammella animalimorsus]PAX17522.1 hemin receptor [Vandammella animalimorsus]PAX19575.1 hemin receptor [Vandammella animalimorsus]